MGFQAFIISCLLAFALGSIPFGYLFGKCLGGGVNLQEEGSGNIGFTNAMRVAGKKVGILTLFFDVLKGVAALMLGRLIISSALFSAGALPQLSDAGAAFSYLSASSPHGWMLAWVYFFAVLGHCFTPFLKGKGGKGIAIGLGGGLAFITLGVLLDLAFFLVVAGVSKKVSLGSLCAAVGIFSAALLYQSSFWYLLPFALVSGVVVGRHASNISKLIAGTESSFSVKK